MLKRDIRPTKDVYYLGIARQISRRSTCLRKKFGAVIVKDDVIVSTGYAGAPRGTPNCIDLKKCFSGNLSDPLSVESCRGVHAEVNAIVNAARTGVNVLGGTLYVFGEHPDGVLAEHKPCNNCRMIIINAGIGEVVVPWKSGMKRYLVKNWIKGSRRKAPFKVPEEY